MPSKPKAPRSRSGRGKRPAEILAEQLPELRRLVGGLSQAALAERLAALGSDMDAQAVAKIEGKRRGVSLNEALELAAALGIYPMHLFLPRHEGNVLLGRKTARSNFTASLMRHWMAGEVPLPLPDHSEDIYELARSDEEKDRRAKATQGMRHVEQEELEEEQELAKQIVGLLKGWSGRSERKRR